MILLTNPAGTADVLNFILQTTSGTPNCTWYCSWAINPGSPPPFGRNFGEVFAVGATVISTPATGNENEIREITIANLDTSPATVTIQINNPLAAYPATLYTTILAAGSILSYNPTPG